MSRREKIILFVVLVAVVYGVYTIFMDSPSKDSSAHTGKQSTGLNKLVSDVIDELKKGAVTEAEAYIIARAEDEWASDPFFEKRLCKTSEAEEAQAPSFTYNGYVEMDRKRLAIIDGLEYETGEELPGGYIIRGIHPDRVVIKGERREKEIIIPLEQETF
jgi:hypothetical protein